MNLELISQAFADRSKLEAARPHVLAAIEALDRGQVRVAEKVEGEWRVHTPLKEAILLYFSLVPMETWSLPPFEFRDKIPLKSDLAAQGVRAVPPGLALLSPRSSLNGRLRQFRGLRGSVYDGRQLGYRR